MSSLLPIITFIITYYYICYYIIITYYYYTIITYYYCNNELIITVIMNSLLPIINWFIIGNNECIITYYRLEQLGDASLPFQGDQAVDCHAARAPRPPYGERVWSIEP